MGHSVMDRIDPAQVQRDYAGLMAVVAIFDAAEDRALAALARHWERAGVPTRLMTGLILQDAAAVQGRLDRARRAAVSEFQVYTWGREVIHA